MKRNYEVALMQHVHGSVADDYETVYYECECGYSYLQCKRKAKELSKHMGKANVPGCGYTFNERKPNKDFYHSGLDEGLAAVKIVCYTETDMTSYEPLYYEYYRDGRIDYKIQFDEPII